MTLYLSDIDKTDQNKLTEHAAKAAKIAADAGKIAHMPEKSIRAAQSEAIGKVVSFHLNR